ncbi:MAG: hypothetical protein Q9184_001226 [Pyrenodesmia sp. 2 TL-2023]
MAKFVAERAHEGLASRDIHFIVVLTLAGFFGLFLIGMSASSFQFLFLNSTTIENLSRKTKVWQLAVHMPTPPPGSDPPPFRTITYGQPLPGAPGAQDPAPTGQPSEPRTFAILHSKPGENPWDLGWRRNFMSVMGDHWYDWFLPIKHSPCARHDRMDCEFETGPVVERMKREARLVIPDRTDNEEKPRRHRRRRRGRSTGTRAGGPETGAQDPGGEEPKRHHRRHRRRRRSESGMDPGDNR